MMNIFGKRKRDESNEVLLEIPGVPPHTTYFGENLNVQGTVSGDEDLQLNGKLEGTIDMKSDVTIYKTAVIHGDVKANSISCSGIVKGDMTTVTKLHLEKTAKVNGKMDSPSVSIDEGAIFDGEMEMDVRGIQK